jgi:hypothetical protein
MNEWQVLMAMEARYERGRFHSRPVERRFWKRWSNFGMRLCRCLGRVEMVAVLQVLNQELEGLIAQVRGLEATIAANVTGILEA